MHHGSQLPRHRHVDLVAFEVLLQLRGSFDGGGGVAQRFLVDVQLARGDFGGLAFVNT